MRRFLILCFVVIHTYIFSQVEHHFMFEYGVFSLKDNNINAIRFVPEIIIENFKMAYGFNFSYDTNGLYFYNQYLSIEGILSKIEYIYYTNNFISVDLSRKNELSMSDKLIIKNFYISHIFPLFYYPSGSLYLNFDFINSELLVDNIINPDIIGFALKVKPLYFFNIDLLKDISLNFDVAIDDDPDNRKSIRLTNEKYYFNDSSTNFIFIYNAGIGLQLTKNIFFNSSLKLDYLSIYSKGNGFFMGLNMEFLKSIYLNLTMGFCGERFIPIYINNFYESEKFDKLKEIDVVNSHYYYKGNFGVNIFEDSMKIDFDIEKSYKNPSFYLSFILLNKFLRVVDLKISFCKENIEKFEDVFYSSDFSRMLIDFKFYMSSNLIFGFEYKYLFHDYEIFNYKNDIYMYLNAKF